MFSANVLKYFAWTIPLRRDTNILFKVKLVIFLLLGFAQIFTKSSHGRPKCSIFKECAGDSPVYQGSLCFETQTAFPYLPLCSAAEESVCGARAGVDVLTPCFCLLSGVAASCGGSPARTGLSPFSSEFPVMGSWGSSSSEWTDEDNDNGLLIFLFSWVSDGWPGVSDSGLTLLLLAFRSFESLWFEMSSVAITSVAMFDDDWCVIDYNRSAKNARKTILCTKN